MAVLNIPVILVTYNRPKHTLEVLRALREHNIKNLYIFSDAPKCEEDVEAVSLTRRLVRSIDWTEPKIIERTENFGLARSIVSAVDSVFEKYDRLILLEDDCVPQRYFFDFMHTCLEKYQDNPRVFGVTGHTVSVPEQLRKSYTYDLYFCPRIGSWGWATWKRAWQHRGKDLLELIDIAIKNRVDLDQGGTDIPIALENILKGDIKDVWTLHWVLSVYLNNGVYIYPTRSHINNIGTDGTGVHCRSGNKLNSACCDVRPTRYPTDVFLDGRIIGNFKKYYHAPPERNRKAVYYLRSLAEKRKPRVTDKLLQQDPRHFLNSKEAGGLLNQLSTQFQEAPCCSSDDAAFQEIYSVIRPYTTLSRQCLYSLFCLSKRICQAHILGNFVECGVAAGGSAALLAAVLKRYSKQTRWLYVFDTFEGMPEPTEHDTHNGQGADATGWGTGTCAAPEESVRQLCAKLGALDVLKIVKGRFEQTLPKMRDMVGMISLLHMDGDWYESTRAILHNLYDRVVNDGLIQVDDYGYWEGCRKAIREFEAERGIRFGTNQIDSTGVWFVKPDKFPVNNSIAPEIIAEFNEDYSKVKHIESQMSPNERFQLYYIVRQHLRKKVNLVRFIEIGSWAGASLSLICLVLKRLNVPFEGFAIEPAGHSQFQQVINGLRSSVQHLKMYSHQAVDPLKSLFERDGNFPELIFVDGDHTYEGVRRDILDYYPLLATGGIMVFHDFLPALDDKNRRPIFSHHGDKEPGIRRACQEIMEEMRRCEVIDLPLLRPTDPTQTQPHLPIIPGVFSTIRVYRKPFKARKEITTVKRPSTKVAYVSAVDMNGGAARRAHVFPAQTPNTNECSAVLSEKVPRSDLALHSAGSRQESDRPRCSKFKVVHLCTLDRGGAGKAAYRLHKGLRSIGVDSTMLVFDKRTNDPTVKVLPTDCSGRPVSCLEHSETNSSIWKQIWHRWVKFADSLANKPKGLDLFSDTISYVKFGTIREIQEADVVHLHWVAGLMDYAGAQAALGGKCIVWTLHDMNPFTGGCHYAGQCTKYTTSCGMCPQLGSAGANDISSQIWKEKYDSYKNLQMQIVTPSRWLAGCVKQSALFGRLGVKVIPNGFPLDVFKPHPKQKIREALNVSKFSKIILFTADAVGNERKGFKYLLEALERLGQGQSENDIALAVIGQSKDQPGLTKFPLIKFGQIRDETQMAMAYSVADIFVVPSLEDNLPNTVVEALACGVPVVGSNVGGIPDMVEHKKTGFLFEPGNVDELLAGIKWGLSIDSEYDQMSRRCRETAVDRYSLQKQAQAYCQLYENLLESNKLQVASRSRPRISAEVLPAAPAEPALPKITIVTPSFNQADYLEACIRSVLDQGYPNLEYIIIDGGSTDGSVEIIKKYADKLAYWVSEPDGGHVDGLNKGFKHSTGEIMGWLNSDDMLHPGALSIVAEVLGQSKEIEWLMGAPTTWDSAGRTVIANHPELWNRARFLSYDYKWIQQESTYWKRSLWQRAGGYVDDKFKLAADLELWVRFFRCARLFSISGLIGGFRTHGRQKTVWGHDKYLQEADAIIHREIELLLNGQYPYMPAKPPLIYYMRDKLAFEPREQPNKKELSVDEEVQALSKAGRELAKAQKPQQALQRFLRVVPLSPNAAQLYSIIGSLYLAIGRDASAKIALKKALQLDPCDSNVRQKLQELGAAKKNLPHNYLASVSWNEPADTRPRDRRVTAENFSHFTYSKWSHIPYFRDGNILKKDSSLKVYQDCLPYTFILDNLPAGAKILEVGGGNSRVIRALKDRYECWNIDKLEGLGGGPKDLQVDGFRLVRDYMGNFNKGLPDNYFDLVFSISTLEHVPQDESTFRNVCLDIDRVMKPGGFSLHCFDVIVKKRGAWTNRLLPYMFEFFRTEHPFIPLCNLNNDPDIWFMSEEGYKRHWKDVAAKQSYEQHGKPMSYNILWQKLPDNSHIKDTAIAASPQAQIARAISSSSSVSNQVCVSQDQAGSEKKYLISAIVSAYNSEQFIAECLEDLENQTIADKLEIVVVNSGSQQNEEAIVKQFQQRYDNIKYIKTERRESVYQAWNRGIKAASGKYITNANTDDRHRPDALEVMVKALEESPDKALAYAHYNGIQLIDGKRRFYYNSPMKPYLSYEGLLAGEYLIGCQPVWRRSVHNEFGYFDEGLIASGDVEFWFRIGQKYDFLYIDETLGEFLERPDSVCHESGRTVSLFESSLVRKCYRAAYRNAAIIGEEGITGSKKPFICDWHAINLCRRKFAEKFYNDLPAAVQSVCDFRSTDKTPSLSVVIVTRNKKDQLLENLGALQNQTEKNFEVIIVDNGEGLGQFTQPNHTLAFELCSIKMSENLGPAFGRNTAAEFAKAPLVAFVDDDAVPDNDWVEKILANFKTRAICGLRGKVSPASQSQDVPDYYDLGPDSVPSMCETPGNSAFRKDIFLKLGGFDTTLFVHEAAELSYRIYDLLDDSPRGVMYAPDVHVRHQPCDQNSADYVDDKTQDHVLQGLTGTRYWRMKSYVNCMRALYPHGQWDFEQKFVDVLNISVILEKDFPELAVPWAQKALQMEPESVKACYMLGSSLLQTGRHAQAEKFLERAMAILARSVVSKPPEMNEEELENHNRALACYISACTELGQCYMHKGDYGKVKTVYLGLLNNSYTPLTPEQRSEFRALVEKMTDVSAQAILPAEHCEHKPTSLLAVSSILAENCPRSAIKWAERADAIEPLEFPSLLAVSLLLAENCPTSAVKWAERAVQMEPLVIKGCFTLGSLYTQLKMFDKAVPVLERTLTLLMADLQAFYADNSQTGRENRANTAACYISVATKLAQCFVQVGRPGKMKTVYSHLLDNSYLELTPEQAGSFQNVMARLGDVEAVAVGDGMEDVPPEAFKDKSDEGPEEPATSRPDEAPVGRSDGRFLVSAIVSTYNSERFLAGCLEDLERQTIADKLEVIVVNSGSEQNEEAIVRRYQQQYDNIVYIKTEQREGLYAAWNQAIKVARGTLLTNANTDDRHRTDALEIMAKILMSNPEVGLVYADQIFTETENATFEDPHATEMHKWPAYSRERLLLGCCVGSQPMWRKSLHTKLGCFDESLTSAGDWDFWIRASGQYKFKRIPDFLGLYYHNKQGLEHGRKIHSLYERYIVGKRYGTEYIATIPLFKGDDYPLVSVIMPAFNAEDYIAQAIQSVLIQNYRNFELIVVDDGSTDRTGQIVQGFEDEKITYLHKENAGASSARNLGIKNSKGEFIVVLDSDDMIQPDYIINHLKEFEKYPDADLIYCDHGLIDPQGAPIRAIEQPEYEDRRHLIRDMFRCGYPIIQPRGCFRRTVIDKIGLYDEDLAVGEDYDLMRRFIKQGLKAHHLKGPMYLRRMHDESLCKTNTVRKAESHFTAIKRVIETFGPDELFPDVQWSQIPQDKIAQHAKCLIAATLLAIAQNYQTTNEPVNVKLALEQARTVLDECLKIDPDNGRARQLLGQCELLGQSLDRAQVVSAAGN